MKKILAVLLTITFVACHEQTPEEKAAQSAKWDRIHGCTEFPAELTEEIGREHNFKWDCNWQAAYNDGDIEILRNDSGRCWGIKYKSAYKSDQQ